MKKVKLNCIFEGDTLPHYGKDGDSAMDVYAYKIREVCNGELKGEIDFPKDGYMLKPLERVLIPSGLKIEFIDGIDADARPRSGMTLKHGIVVQLGMIDTSYRGDVGLIVINMSNDTYTIKKGERLGQLRFSKPILVDFNIVDKINSTVRATSGFGDSGK